MDTRWTAICLMRENINAVVVSHESKATQRLLQRVHFFLDNLKGPPANVKKNRNTIEFKTTGSTFFIGTAGSDNFGRGDTIHLLHCSEYAMWQGGQELLKGMLASVPMMGSEVAIESTGRGHNDYARRCYRAMNTKNKLILTNSGSSRSSSSSLMNSAFCSSVIST